MLRRSAVVLTGTIFVLAGCSSPAARNAPPTPDFGSGVTVTPGMTGSGTGNSTPGMGSMTMTAPEPGNAGPAAPAGPNAVNIDNFAFAPASLTVAAGTTVTWTNHDEDPHNIVAENGQFRSPTMSSGGTYSYKFVSPGTFAYVCGIHPFMHGTVVVTP